MLGARPGGISPKCGVFPGCLPVRWRTPCFLSTASRAALPFPASGRHVNGSHGPRCSRVRGRADAVHRAPCAACGRHAAAADAPLRSYFFAYSSIGLSFGAAQAALVASDSGRPTLVLAGGIGCMNHLS